MEDSLAQIRKAFGMLFVLVALAVFSASSASYFVAMHHYPFALHAAIWLGSFGLPFGLYFAKARSKMMLIRSRMKNSVSWPGAIKAVNGSCWAAPFALIGVFPSLLQYLILFGIGLGNMSTYIFMKRFSGISNNEQLIVGAVSLASIPVAFVIDQTLFMDNQMVAVFLSRILIGLSYAFGGIFALFIKK